MVAVVTALAVLAVAGLLLANRTGAIAGTGWALAIGVVVVLVGAGIVVTGLRGRRSGVLSLLAIVGLVAAPSAVTQAQGWGWDWSATQAFGEADVTPTTRDAAAEGVRLGAGNARVDLTAVPLTATTLTVPVSVNAGEVEVVVPAGADVRAEIDVFAGQVSWTVDGQSEQASGRIADDLVYTTSGVDAGATPSWCSTCGSGPATSRSRRPTHEHDARGRPPRRDPACRRPGRSRRVRPVRPVHRRRRCRQRQWGDRGARRRAPQSRRERSRMGWPRAGCAVARLHGPRIHRARVR
ncbi:LiaF domain-containing protein [Litorihabitans aurantiacus]|uniref:Cell wall-active antibiotics response LiaF-like C-terminal domain-containing protein n=1 Tax=Litorihabitans aurantiacus TaxID=1930061 RepID=A0AA38CS48_9MICO|nr:LiaF domain-containing protein [Litorihabitans aurantiacus]GMA32216.1 hypothetical protein GCM10025875_22080 [Litorihabitans aurantiacus]